jgi:hypothetical protein
MATPTTLPSTFAASSVLTSTQMNDLRGAFRVLQVVSTTKTDLFSTTSTSFVDVTGLSVAITPTSSSSLVLVTASVVGAQPTTSSSSVISLRLVRDSTNIAIGDAAGSRIQATSAWFVPAGDSFLNSIEFLDTPNTTSATTYKIQSLRNEGTGTYYINATRNDDNATTRSRTVSTITAMEISA